MTRYDIAANVVLAGLDGYTGQLSAAQQRQVFGANLFGRKHLTIDASNQGRVFGSFSVCFGTDRCTFEKSFDEIAQAATGDYRMNW